MLTTLLTSQVQTLPDDDQARTFLESYIERHDSIVPANRDGVIRMRAK